MLILPECTCMIKFFSEFVKYFNNFSPKMTKNMQFFKGDFYKYMWPYIQ